MTARHFVIYDSPSVADPAWQIMAAELHQGGSYTEFSDLSVIKGVIERAETKAAESAGVAKELDRIMKLLRLNSYPELYELVEEQRRAKC